MKEESSNEQHNEPEKFTDAGDGTCMECGRDREECYCGIPTR